jgi:hypothetical protein
MMRGENGLASGHCIESADDVDGFGRLTHSYQLVEGRLLGAGEGAGRVDHNFARNWKSDFTIAVAYKDASAFAAEGIDPKGLASIGCVRGWVVWRNGPVIKATHPEQIELLADDPKEDKPKTRQQQEPGPASAL